MCKIWYTNVQSLRVRPSVDKMSDFRAVWQAPASSNRHRPHQHSRTKRATLKRLNVLLGLRKYHVLYRQHENVKTFKIKLKIRRK